MCVCVCVCVCVYVCVSIPKVEWMLKKCLMDLCCLCCMSIHLGCVLEGKHWQSKDGKHCEFNMGNSRCTQPAGSHRILA